MTVAELREAAGQAAERRAAATLAAVAALPDAVMTDCAARTDAPESPGDRDVDVADAASQEGPLADGSGDAVASSAAAAVKPEAAGEDAEEALPRDGPSASQCPVCLEPMAAKVPHIYPCGHVFCRECSEKVLMTHCTWMLLPGTSCMGPMSCDLTLSVLVHTHVSRSWEKASTLHV